jgi:hypothetical protein
MDNIDQRRTLTLQILMNSKIDKPNKKNFEIKIDLEEEKKSAEE